MFKRLRLPLLLQMLQEFPAVAILGPRQVGKTTLALELMKSQAAATYLDLESPADAAKLTDPLAYFAANADRLVVIDEVQRSPELFPVLRAVIDQRRRLGQRHAQFLLLGSATGALLAQSAESLAGRIAYMELPPLITLEVPQELAQSVWTRGGFPESLQAQSDSASLRWRQQFITTYLERDIPQLGPRIPAQTLGRLWTMLAHEQGQLFNAAKLAGALAISGQTVARYLDLLCDLMLLRRLQPWAANEGKRLVRTPKVYVRDSGIAHALLGLGSFNDIVGHPVAGGSWEGFVIENLLAVTPLGTQASFYRSAAGAEIDLILQLPQQERWVVEIKRSSAPVLSRGFHSAAEDLQAHQRFVVHSGSDTYPLSNGVLACTLQELQTRLMNYSATSATALPAVRPNRAGPTPQTSKPAR
jgi:uncharacterized protein